MLTRATARNSHFFGCCQQKCWQQPACLVWARSGFAMASSGNLAPAEVWGRSGALLELTQDPSADPEHDRTSAVRAMPHQSRTKAIVRQSGAGPLPIHAGPCRSWPERCRTAPRASRSTAGARPSLAGARRSCVY